MKTKTTGKGVRGVVNTKTLCIVLSAGFILVGCASSPSRPPSADAGTHKLPTLTLGTEIVLTRDDQKVSSPSRLSLSGDQERYYANEATLHALLTLPLLKGRHLLQWKWMNPSDQVYIETEPIPVGQAGDIYQEVQSLHKINIKGEAAAQRVGIWHLQAVLSQPLDSPTIIERQFEIAPEPLVVLNTQQTETPPPPSPPPSVITEQTATSDSVSAEDTPLDRQEADVQQTGEKSFAPPVPPPPVPPGTGEKSFAPTQRIQRCPGVADIPSVISIFFEMGKTTLSPTMKHLLADRIKQFTQDKIVVRGYHDSIGSLSLNRRLSNQRAEAVADFLVQQGIGRERIRVEGQMECYFEENNTPSNRMQNRRVTVEEDQ